MAFEELIRVVDNETSCFFKNFRRNSTVSFSSEKWNPLYDLPRWP